MTYNETDAIRDWNYKKVIKKKKKKDNLFSPSYEEYKESDESQKKAPLLERKT